MRCPTVVEVLRSGLEVSVQSGEGLAVPRESGGGFFSSIRKDEQFRGGGSRKRGGSGKGDGYIVDGGVPSSFNPGLS